MKIAELYQRKKTVISFEIFPPKKEADLEGIDRILAELGELSPDFISVTYSAGGMNNSAATFDIASKIQNEHQILSLAHMTCINSTPEQVAGNLEKAKLLGIENIMALRGDIPADYTGTPHYLYAKDLIAKIKKEQPQICIGAAAYTEGHTDCESVELGVEHLKQKADAGADFFVTQLFFDNRFFYEFYDKTLAVGLDLPISAGIMPILSKSQIEKMIFMCGASLPARIVKMLGKYENSPEDLKKAAMEYSAEQINDLIAHKVDGVHIYTMNRPEIARGNLEKIRYGNRI
ncbi:MAG: methylenetetrahydrofolate reductase [NAD(P)H] [Ruminococcaceae bacterium]|nr:methylenetetrahydrofolate reductase [NAD(P)H] [Oscillospiraceae bacterium]